MGQLKGHIVGGLLDAVPGSHSRVGGCDKGVGAWVGEAIPVSMYLFVTAKTGMVVRQLPRVRVRAISRTIALIFITFQL